MMWGGNATQFIAPVTEDMDIPSLNELTMQFKFDMLNYCCILLYLPLDAWAVVRHAVTEVCRS